jgi:hypothetical protein
MIDSFSDVESTPEIQARRERESRLALTNLGTMIGLSKNARQFHSEFTVSKVRIESSLNHPDLSSVRCIEAQFRFNTVRLVETHVIYERPLLHVGNKCFLQAMFQA